MDIGGAPDTEGFGGAGDLLLDLDEDFPALDGGAGDLLLALDEDFPEFGGDLLFLVFLFVTDDSPFFFFRDVLVSEDLVLALDEDFPE